MALTQALQEARAATRNRRVATVEKLRMDELELVREDGELTGDYFEADRNNDAQFVAAAKTLHETLTNDEQRKALYRLISIWMQGENSEEALVGQHDGHNARTLGFMRSNNPIFVSGAYVPDGSEPVA
jgi:hypothetical protein